MPELRVKSRTGVEKTVAGKPGRSVMEVIREAGFDELLALCGGNCSCATCHVYVDPGFAGALPAMAEDEDELLEGSSWRTAESRLSCQVPFGPELDGLAVTIAPED